MFALTGAVHRMSRAGSRYTITSFCILAVHLIKTVGIISATLSLAAVTFIHIILDKSITAIDIVT